MPKQKVEPMPDELDKAAAAAYLGVSERAIERYTSRGLLTPRDVQQPSESDGRMRRRTMYTREQLDAVQGKMQEQTESQAIMPAVRAGDPAALATINAAVEQIAARFGEQLVATIATARPVAELSSAPGKPRKKRKPSPPRLRLEELAHKHLLTFEEAARLSGLTLDWISQGVANKELFAVGDTLIKRTELETWIANL